VIGHLALSETVGWLAQQRCKVLAEMAAGKACRQKLEQQEGTPESLHLRIGEAQCGGALRCQLDWTIDFLKSFFGEDAIVADALHLKQSSIGLKADAPERGQVAQVLADIKVIGVVDGSFCT
jgi:hypothetical protein